MHNAASIGACVRRCGGSWPQVIKLKNQVLGGLLITSGFGLLSSGLIESAGPSPLTILSPRLSSMPSPPLPSPPSPRERSALPSHLHLTALHFLTKPPSCSPPPPAPPAVTADQTHL